MFESRSPAPDGQQLPVGFSGGLNLPLGQYSGTVLNVDRRAHRCTVWLVTPDGAVQANDVDAAPAWLEPDLKVNFEVGLSRGYVVQRAGGDRFRAVDAASRQHLSDWHTSLTELSLELSAKGQRPASTVIVRLTSGNFDWVPGYDSRDVRPASKEQGEA